MINFLETPIVAPPYVWLIDNANNNRIGVHDEKGWCILIRDEIIYFDSESACMVLLPLLEIERATFFSFLEKLDIDRRDVFIEKFPEVFLLLYAFKYGGGYWAEKAFNWVSKERKAFLRVRNDLEVLVKNKKFPQKLLHKVIKLLRGNAK